MSKGLEALERLYCAGNLQLDYVRSNKHKEDYDTIEKELTVLEIIQNKFILVEKMYDTKLVINIPLTKDEIDLLKEVLKHE